MDRTWRRWPSGTDRATLAGTGLAVVATPALALATGVVETLFAPTAMLAVAAVALTWASVALARGHDPIVTLADARIWLATALLVDAELLARLLGGAGAGLGVVYAAVAGVVGSATTGPTMLGDGFLAFCLALGVALVTLHDAVAARRAAAHRGVRDPADEWKR
jgi:hypothetical protein